MADTPDKLVEACEAARRSGKDFPTIWRTILRPCPLVIGLPGHKTSTGEAVIVVSLRTGQQLLSSYDRYWLA